MINKFYYLFFISLILTIGFIQIYASEDTEIIVDITGDSTIDLNSENRLIRAYVKVINFDPSDGYYLMEIIQSSSGITISEQEILIREKGNDIAGASVAYMVDEEEILKKVDHITGDYKILIKTESGNSIGSTNFFLVGNSEHEASLEIENEIEQASSTEANSSNDGLTIQSMDNKTEHDSFNNNGKTTKIPDWVRNIFTLYVEKKISENELLEAIKFLLAQRIIVV